MENLSNIDSFNVHLFFDVFIEDAPLGVYLRGDKKRFNYDKKIREIDSSYRYQTKLDITRYSLYSYSSLQWKSATIRVECENDSHRFIYDEIKELFPRANIIEKRSATAREYLDSLSKIESEENDWIFFSPNNDHPFLENPEKFYKLVHQVNVKYASEFDNEIITFPFSHFTESINSLSIFSPLWGYYGNIYPKLVEENENFYLVKLNRLLLDSVHMYRYKDLLTIFSENTNEARVIRTEDTSLYLSNFKDHFVIISKFELCRHYDGYTDFLDKVPPLFIPDNFFKKKVKIYYGEKSYKNGYVNINPKNHKYIFQSNSGTDLINTIDDIPFFWKEHISEIHNEFENQNFIKKEIIFYKNLTNPWSKNILVNLFKSFLRLSFNTFKNSIKFILLK